MDPNSSTPVFSNAANGTALEPLPETNGYNSSKKPLNKKFIILGGIFVILVILTIILVKILSNNNNDVNISSLKDAVNDYANYVIYGEESIDEISEEAWQSEETTYANSIFYEDEDIRNEYLEHLSSILEKIKTEYQKNYPEPEDNKENKNNIEETDQAEAESEEQIDETRILLKQQIDFLISAFDIYSVFVKNGEVDYESMIDGCYSNDECTETRNIINQKIEQLEASEITEFSEILSDLMNATEEKYSKLKIGVLDTPEIDERIDSLNAEVMITYKQISYRLLKNVQGLYEIIEGIINE